jgi:hypothetical protein
MTPTKFAALLTATLMLSIVKGTDVVFRTLDGIGYKDTSTLRGLKVLSLAGGAPLLLSGTNLASSSGSDSIKFEPQWLLGSQIFGPALTCKLYHLCLPNVCS